MKVETPNVKTQLGGICGQNSKSGIITNCIVSGNIEAKMLYGKTVISGIAPYNSGSIQKCGNYSNIHVEISIGEEDPGSNECYIGRDSW